MVRIWSDESLLLLLLLWLVHARFFRVVVVVVVVSFVVSGATPSRLFTLFPAASAAVSQPLPAYHARFRHICRSTRIVCTPQYLRATHQAIRGVTLYAATAGCSVTLSTSPEAVPPVVIAQLLSQSARLSHFPPPQSRPQLSAFMCCVDDRRQLGFTQRSGRGIVCTEACGDVSADGSTTGSAVVNATLEWTVPEMKSGG